MLKKTLAGLATTVMLLPVGFIPALPANAYTSTVCSFVLTAPDGAKASAVEVDVHWLYSSSGASVKPLSVFISNKTSRSITLSVNRWQNSSESTLERGIGGEIPSNNTVYWYPQTYIPINQSPYVWVAAYATSRAGMNGYVKVTPTSCQSSS
jgi:hypothetical protein